MNLLHLSKLSSQQYALGSHRLILNNNKLTIIFRGTYEYADFIRPFNINKTKLNNNNFAHSGIYNKTHQLIPDIDNFVNNNIQDIHTINITGHSVGGSIGLIYGNHICNIHQNMKVNVTTFGSPPITTQQITNNNLHVTRCEISNDIIPLISLKLFIHTGHKITIQNNSTIYYIPNNHACKTYVNLIKNN
jgi:hypothetical protein